MKSILPYSVLISLSAACVPSGEFVDFKDGEFTSVQSESSSNVDAIAALEARLAALEEQKYLVLELKNNGCRKQA